MANQSILLSRQESTTQCTCHYCDLSCTTITSYLHRTDHWKTYQRNTDATSPRMNTWKAARIDAVLHFDKLWVRVVHMCSTVGCCQRWVKGGCQVSAAGSQRPRSARRLAEQAHWSCPQLLLYVAKLETQAHYTYIRFDHGSAAQKIIIIFIQKSGFASLKGNQYNFSAP